MYKLAAIIGGVLLMAGVALAGTVTSLGATGSPTIGKVSQPISSIVRQEDRRNEVERRGRANEPGEDLRGPCDEAEHASDPRCGAPVAPRFSTTAPHFTVRDDHRGRDRGDRSGRGHGSDDGGHSGHGGHGGDD
jgi:hypothetical protein